MKQAGLHTQKETLIKYDGEDNEIVLPSEITQIHAGAFCGCITLKAVTIKANCIRILSKNLFADCTALQKVSIWGEVEDSEEKRFVRPAELRDYLGITQQTVLEWECPTIWCMEGRCQFCGGTLRGSVMRSCSVCGRFA
ncbi:MAG: leucine-rich repeat domain-containing protein [Clostridia bacterium]|nr:leucine-rich repeat domain-containing protein [Clostridia bacterium]